MAKDRSRKRRLNAKKIAQTPSLKRKMAEIIAEFAPRTPELSLTHILTYGIRGYISYSEEELGKLFDKIFSEELARTNEAIKDLELRRPKMRAWEVSTYERDIESKRAHIARFEQIANEVFEDTFL